MFGYKLFTFVAETTAPVVERFGRYHKTLQPGFNWLVPIIDRISKYQTLKETAIKIENQQAITKDNVTIHIEGYVFIRIIDPFKATYNIEDYELATTLLCQTILRSEIGKKKLDQLLQERGELNEALMKGLNKTAEEWGLTSLGVEILSLDPPEEIKKSMQKQIEAERTKRKEILLSEGKQIREINIATGAKVAAIKRAEGDAESIKIVAENEAGALSMISETLKEEGRHRVVDYMLLQQYLRGYQNILQSSRVIVLPKGAEGKGSDLMNLGALMMMGNTGGFRTSSGTAENASASGSSQSSKQPSSQHQQDITKLNQDQLLDLVNNNKFYPDIRLYSDEEDKRR